MMKKQMSKWMLCGAVFACSGTVMQAQAVGINTPYVSAASSGVANAVIAGGDDVSMAAQNAAAIAWQPGTQLMLGTMSQYQASSMKLTAGSMVSNTGYPVKPAHVYASWMPKGQDWGASFAWHTPFAVENIWSTAVTSADGMSKLRADRLAADGIYAVNSNLAVSLGVDFYRATTTLNRTGASFSARDKAAFAAHAGMKYKFAPTWSLGASYQKGAKLSFRDASSSTSALQLPDQIKAGIAKELPSNWRLEADAAWTRWSQANDMHVKNAAGTITQNNTLNLKDDWSVMTGATWYWRPDAQLRLGYAYDAGQSTLTATELRTTLANQGAQHFSLGLGADMFGVHIDTSYAYIYGAKRTVTGLGELRDTRQSLSFDISKKF